MSGVVSTTDEGFFSSGKDPIMPGLLIAFDFDGTLNHPKFGQRLADLARILQLAGCSLIVLTVVVDSGDGSEKAALRFEAVRDMGLGALPVQVLVAENAIAGGKLKADWCAHFKVSMLIDDSLGYCKAVAHESPSTIPLHLVTR